MGQMMSKKPKCAPPGVWPAARVARKAACAGAGRVPALARPYRRARSSRTIQGVPLKTAAAAAAAAAACALHLTC